MTEKVDNEDVELQKPFTSFAMAFINGPPILVESLWRPAKLAPDYSCALKEDGDLIEQALRGECIPARYLDQINEAQIREGTHFPILPYKLYAEDKASLLIIRK